MADVEKIERPAPGTTKAGVLGELMRLAGGAYRVEHFIHRRYPDLRRVAVGHRSIVSAVRAACLELTRAAQVLADAEDLGSLDSGAFYDQRFGPLAKPGFGPPPLGQQLRFLSAKAESLRHELDHSYPDLRRLPVPVRQAVKDTRIALAVLQTTVAEWIAESL
jgi:hypothetical protein